MEQRITMHPVKTSTEYSHNFHIIGTNIVMIYKIKSASLMVGELDEQGLVTIIKNEKEEISLAEFSRRYREVFGLIIQRVSGLN